MPPAIANQRSNLFVQPAFSVFNDERSIERGVQRRFTSVHFNIKEVQFDTAAEYVTGKQFQTIKDNPWPIHDRTRGYYENGKKEHKVPTVV